jgi:hypothetical protein
MNSITIFLSELNYLKLNKVVNESSDLNALDITKVVKEGDMYDVTLEYERLDFLIIQLLAR